ncbi:hypothetical protein [Bacillus sp. FSL K6-3431]
MEIVPKKLHAVFANLCSSQSIHEVIRKDAAKYKLNPAGSRKDIILFK